MKSVMKSCSIETHSIQEYTVLPKSPQTCAEHCSDVVDLFIKLDLDGSHSIIHMEIKLFSINHSYERHETDDQDMVQDVDICTSPPLKSRLRK